MTIKEKLIKEKKGNVRTLREVVLEYVNKQLDGETEYCSQGMQDLFKYVFVIDRIYMANKTRWTHRKLKRYGGSGTVYNLSLKKDEILGNIEIPEKPEGEK